MRTSALWLLGTAAVLLCPGPAAAQTDVAVGPQGEIRVAGKAFVPVMVHNQPVRLWPQLIELGVNTFAANDRPEAASTVREYLDAAARHKVYVMLPPPWINAEGPETVDAVRKSPWVLALRYPDEPDLTHPESDILVDAPQARQEGREPLCHLFDGDVATRGVLDPVRGFSLTVTVPERHMRLAGAQRVPLEVTRLVVVQHNPEGFLTLPDKVQFLADGKEVLTVDLADTHRLAQTFDLPRPVAFRTLTIKVLGVHQGRTTWGAWAELQALTADGRNVFQSAVRNVPRHTAGEVAVDCRRWRETYGKLVLVGTTSRFAQVPTLEHVASPLPVEDYAVYHAAGDMAITNLFPLNWNGRPVTLDCFVLNSLARVGGLRDGRPKPIAVWMACGLPNPERATQGARSPTPAELRTNALLNFIHGAKMVPWFTQRVTPGDFAYVDIPAENRAEMKRLAALVTRLAEVIGGPAADGPTWQMVSPATDVVQPPRSQMVRLAPDGSKYLFIVNPSDKPAKATLSLGEGEALEALLADDVALGRKAGGIEATFPPWHAQVYRLAKSPAP